jgi:hypothetical protein
MVRLWCRDHTDGLNLDGDYQQWVVDGFSGVLCVDEVYQDRLALLVAVDPAAPAGDRLVGDQLVHGEVQQTDVARLLERLRDAGIAPDQVITDASPLYPTALRAVWPAAAHQLCLFHETRLVVDAVAQVIQDVRATLPKALGAVEDAVVGHELAVLAEVGHEVEVVAARLADEVAGQLHQLEADHVALVDRRVTGCSW